MTAQPSSISSGVRTASDAASGSRTNSCDVIARALDALLQVLQDAGEHRNEVDLGLQPRPRHADGLVDPALLVDQIVLRNGVQQLVVPPEADVARHVVDPGHVAGPDLVARDATPCRASCAPPRARPRCRSRPNPLRPPPYAGRSSSLCRWPEWFLRCHEPRRAGSRCSSPRPRPGSERPRPAHRPSPPRWRRRPWSSRGRAPPPAAEAGRSCARPADDHLTGEASIQFLV